MVFLDGGSISFVNPTLEKHSKERIKTYQEEGFTDITVFKMDEWRESLKITV